MPKATKSISVKTISTLVLETEKWISLAINRDQREDDIIKGKKCPKLILRVRHPKKQNTQARARTQYTVHSSSVYCILSVYAHTHTHTQKAKYKKIKNRPCFTERHMRASDYSSGKLKMLSRSTEHVISYCGVGFINTFDLGTLTILSYRKDWPTSGPCLEKSRDWLLTIS